MMVALRAMYLWKDYTVLYFLFISQCYAISCRNEHSSKQDELKKVFNNCLKQIEGNSSENRRNSAENWGDRGYSQRQNWQRDSKNENKDNRMKNRNSRMGERDSREDDESNNKNNRDMRENSSNRMDNGQNRMGTRSDRLGDVNGVEVNAWGRRDNNMMNNYNREHRLSGQDEFLQSEEYGSDNSHHAYYPSSQSSRRYRRENRKETNSGQRSQYNPHSQRSNSHEDGYSNGKNTSDNSSKEVNRACVMHCFLENLHMTGDSGMPDRYLVTHTLIKDQKNEDLRDFIQESIEECFQILDNENTEDKCEFSKNLLTCLSEKGKANCDDWAGKTSFLFE